MKASHKKMMRNPGQSSAPIRILKCMPSTITIRSLLRQEKSMPEVRINLSQQAIALLEKLKKEHGLRTRGKALEMIIEELLAVTEVKNSEPEG